MYLLLLLLLFKTHIKFSIFIKSLKIIETSDNDQPTGWDTSPSCKINGDNAVYSSALNNRKKKKTEGLDVLLSTCFSKFHEILYLEIVQYNVDG